MWKARFHGSCGIPQSFGLLAKDALSRRNGFERRSALGADDVVEDVQLIDLCDFIVMLRPRGCVSAQEPDYVVAAKQFHVALPAAFSRGYFRKKKSPLRVNVVQGRSTKTKISVHENLRASQILVGLFTNAWFLRIRKGFVFERQKLRMGHNHGIACPAILLWGCFAKGFDR